MIYTALNSHIAKRYIQEYLGSGNISYLNTIAYNIKSLDDKFKTIKILPLEEYEQLKAQQVKEKDTSSVVEGGKKIKSKKHRKKRNRKTKKYRK